MITRKGVISGIALVALATGFSVQAAEGTERDITPSMGMGMPMPGMGMGPGMGRDENAKITKAQFLEQADVRFTRMDINKDGVIDASDRQQMRARMKECMEMMDGMGMMGKGGMGMMGGGKGMMGSDKGAADTKEHESHHAQ